MFDVALQFDPCVDVYNEETTRVYVRDDSMMISYLSEQSHDLKIKRRDNKKNGFSFCYLMSKSCVEHQQKNILHSKEADNSRDDYFFSLLSNLMQSPLPTFH